MDWSNVAERIEFGEGRRIEERAIQAARPEDVDFQAFRSSARDKGRPEEPGSPHGAGWCAAPDGLMEQRGRGWPVIRREMQKFNGTDAELVQDEGGKFVRVTLRLGAPGASLPG